MKVGDKVTFYDMEGIIKEIYSTSPKFFLVDFGLGSLSQPISEENLILIGDAKGIEIGSTIRFNNRIGIVERILEDDNGKLAIVRFIGNSEFNLTPINIDYIECVDNPYIEQAREASKIIHSTLDALRDSVSNKVTTDYIDELQQIIFEYEESRYSIFDDY